MGIPGQEVKPASSGLPDNEVRKHVLFCLRRPQVSKLRGCSNKPLLPIPENRINDEQKRQNTLPIGKRLKTHVPKPSHYECPEGPAFMEAACKRIRIRAVLDSGSNIFLINQHLVEHFDIPYEISQKALNILAFDREINSSGGKHFTHPIILEITSNDHRTSFSCVVAAAGRYDLIIPFG